MSRWGEEDYEVTNLEGRGGPSLGRGGAGQGGAGWGRRLGTSNSDVTIDFLEGGQRSANGCNIGV